MSLNPVTIHGMSTSGNCHKVRLPLNQLGRSCVWIETDTTLGKTRTPEFLCLNPAGKVPLLVREDGQVLSESGAILFWLVEGTRGLQTLRWMFFEQYRHEPCVAVARYIRRFLPAGHAREAELPQLLQRGVWRGGAGRDGSGSARVPMIQRRCLRHCRHRVVCPCPLRG